MTGTKKDREALKNRYRKGMYPTENDFADVFESYVHKDDDIPMSKVVITDGDGKTTTLSGEIDKKADKTTLQTFIDETETILQVVRNDNNQIASTAIDNLHSRIQAAEDDIDTAEDNISGHETRIATLESSKTDYEAFKERVRAFMEDADASDATINRWREIETFLQGITDTETLTVLLNDLKNEILAEIPEPQPQPSGNYLELVEDLDAITDAPNGKIVKYVGQTNEKYTRGFDYERVAGDQVVIPVGTNTIKIDVDGRTIPMYLSDDTISSESAYSARVWKREETSWRRDTNNTDTIIIALPNSNYADRVKALIYINGTLCYPEIRHLRVHSADMCSEISEGGSIGYYLPEYDLLVDDDTFIRTGFSRCFEFTSPESLSKVHLHPGQGDESIDNCATWHAFYIDENGFIGWADDFVTINGAKGDMSGFGTPKTTEESVYGHPTSWQPIPSFNVIN